MRIEKLVSLEKGYVLSKRSTFVSLNASTGMVRVKSIKTGEINRVSVPSALKLFK